MSLTVMNTPKITIVIMSFNRPNYLAETVESALGQTMESSIVVLDDCSDLNMEPVMSSFRNRQQITVIRNPTNLGINRNTQRALEVSGAEYLCIFADDDPHDPLFIERCVNALQNCPDAVAAGTRSMLIDADGETIGVPEVQDVSMSPLCRLTGPEFARLYFNHRTPARMYIGAMVFRTSMLQKAGVKYRAVDFARCADDLFIAELTTRGLPFLVIGERLCRRRIHGGMNSISSPDVVDELLCALTSGSLFLADAPAQIKEGYQSFVFQSLLYTIREMGFSAARTAWCLVRRRLNTSDITLRPLLQECDWKWRFEFSSPIMMYLVRHTRTLRLALRRKLFRHAHLPTPGVQEVH